MSGLTVTRMTAGYDGSTVVRDIDLRVGAGEIVALLGANGAGKTTILRGISGTVTPTAGMVEIAGTVTTGRSVKAVVGLGLTHVPDHRGVFGSLTVEDHFRLGRRGQRLDMAEAFHRFPALARVRHRRAALLSGGEQQMLALACALARRPRVLLIDEMSMGLAPLIVRRILPIIKLAATELGTAVLMVEQNIHQALETADRGYVLAQGRIAIEGPAQALRDNYESVLANYLGERDLISGPAARPG